jgi:hypothetical protein
MDLCRVGRRQIVGGPRLKGVADVHVVGFPEIPDADDRADASVRQANPVEARER